MEVKIISTEMVRPASPTPPHLRNFNLSMLDQFSPHLFIPLILYYPSHQMGNITTADTSRRLKSSLSQSLVQFYPLAGRFVAKENKIECNDQLGVEFYETRVLHCHLDELLENPNQFSLSELVPCYNTCSKYSGREDGLLALQANFFDCGGLALGVSISHLIGDTATFVTFLNGWASTAGEEGSTLAQKTPFVVHHHLFPHVPGVSRPAFQFATNPTMKRFVIDEFNLASLRRKRLGTSTRVEAVTALVSRCMARATRKNGVEGRDERGFIVFHAVDLRRRMEPPLPDDAFGNFWVIVVALPEGSPADDEDGRLEVQLRETFKKVDATLTKELQGPQRYQAVEAMVAGLSKYQGKETAAFMFSSWFKFGYYEVDFGWGKPQWVSPALLPLKNFCFFLRQKEGDGIEVWANMEAEDMAKFEHDQELISYVSPSYN